MGNFIQEIDPREIPLGGLSSTSVVVTATGELPRNCQAILIGVQTQPTVNPDKAAMLELGEEGHAIDRVHFGSALSVCIDRYQIKPKRGQVSVYPLYDKPVLECGAFCIGDVTESTAYEMVEVGSMIGDAVRKLCSDSLALVMPKTLTKCHLTRLVQGLYRGLAHPMTRSYSETPVTPVKVTSIAIVCDPAIVGCVNSGIQHAQLLAESSYFVAELTFAPANYCTTETLCAAFRQMANESGLKIAVLEEAELVRKRMGGIINVGRGSRHPPKLVHVTYEPPHGCDAKCKQNILAMIGKGVCFDSGGLNLKTDGASIRLMKMDMSGAASVMGAARAIAALKPKNICVHFLAPLVENMVSRHAYRPGDIITMHNGKKVEVGNTDAEGRLILADALSYAATGFETGEDKPAIMLSSATLTGAALVALGPEYAAVMSRNPTAQSLMLEAGQSAGELMHPLPMGKVHKAVFETGIGDCSNIALSMAGGSRMAGCQSAGIFLNYFNHDVPFVHVDIAGPAMDRKDMGTGAGTCAFVRFAMMLDEMAQSKPLTQVFSIGPPPASASASNGDAVCGRP